MKTNKAAARNIDEYIAGFPIEVQEILQKIRATIREAAPDASEAISYQMPVFKLYGVVVYFAAFKNHIGFFPTASGVAAFCKDLVDYVTTKGTIQLPYNKPVPYELITKIVKFRVAENIGKAKWK